MTTEISTPLLIDGQERAVSATFPVYDPAANGTVIGHAAAASATVAAAKLVGVDGGARPKSLAASPTI